MKDFIEKCLIELPRQHFDCVAVGFIDFAKSTVQSFEIGTDLKIGSGDHLFFDLASLTKPLTLASTYFLKEGLFEKNDILLLNHCAGFPIGGRLNKDNWKKQLEAHTIKESQALYSDFSALRLMLEIEKKSEKKLYSLCSSFWDRNLIHWEKIINKKECPITGMRGHKEIQGEVHDDNAYNLRGELSHAGLFGTVNGLANSLLNLNAQTDLLEKMTFAFDKKTDRFLYGFDTVSSPNTTLAGPGCSQKTFGHLGFTGTSFWIDSEKKRGGILLTNETKGAWYSRGELNNFRKEIGKLFWAF